MGEQRDDNVEPAPRDTPGVPPMRPVYVEDATEGGGLGPWPGRLLQIVVFVGVVVVYQFVRDALGFWTAIGLAVSIAAVAYLVSTLFRRRR